MLYITHFLKDEIFCNALQEGVQTILHLPYKNHFTFRLTFPHPRNSDYLHKISKICTKLGIRIIKQKNIEVALEPYCSCHLPKENQ